MQNLTKISQAKNVSKVTQAMLNCVVLFQELVVYKYH